jgi:hypothetical protein
VCLTGIRHDENPWIMSQGDARTPLMVEIPSSTGCVSIILLSSHRYKKGRNRPVPLVEPSELTVKLHVSVSDEPKSCVQYHVPVVTDKHHGSSALTSTDAKQGPTPPKLTT